MTDMTDLIRGEREALVELLDRLTPDQWSTPSLCSVWNVQQVAAHLAWAPVWPLRQLVSSLVSSRFRLNQVNADNAVRWATRGPVAIVEQLRANAAAGARPRGVPTDAVLADAVVHAVDIRRPLGAPGHLSRDVFVPTADFHAGIRWPLNVSVGGDARRRVADLRLVADDQDWAHGEGPEVHGSGEALLLMLAGRGVAAGELSGPGAPLLEGRIRAGR